jgi:hypothetical protein
MLNTLHRQLVLRDRPYPDVLIELLIELLDGLRARLKPQAWYRVDQRVTRVRVRRLAACATGFGVSAAGLAAAAAVARRSRSARSRRFR